MRGLVCTPMGLSSHMYDIVQYGLGWLSILSDFALLRSTIYDSATIVDISKPKEKNLTSLQNQTRHYYL